MGNRTNPFKVGDTVSMPYGKGRIKGTVVSFGRGEDSWRMQVQPTNKKTNCLSDDGTAWGSWCEAKPA